MTHMPQVDLDVIDKEFIIELKQKYKESYENHHGFYNLNRIFNKVVQGFKYKSKLFFINKKGDIATFDLGDMSKQKIRLLNDNETFKVNNVVSLNTFFAHNNLDKISEVFQDEKYVKFIEKIGYIESQCSNVGTFLNKLSKYRHLENYILLNANFEPTITKKTTDYNKEIFKILLELSKDERVDFKFSRSFEHAVSFYRKEQMKLIEDSIKYIYEVFYKKNDIIAVNEFLNIFYSYRGVELFTNIVIQYNCEYKRAISYIIIDICRHESFGASMSAIRFWNDCLRMQSYMTDKINKYPKYLKSTHDIIMKNYNNYKKEFQEELFQKQIKPELEYNPEKKRTLFFIKYPDETSQIKQEGADLSHCVGSYIQTIIDGETDILFLRDKAEPEKSLVTIEVKQGALYSAKGFGNRDCNNVEKDFLIDYAKEKGLEVNKYL